MVSAAAPTPGSITALAFNTSAGLVVTLASWPKRLMAFTTLRRLPAP
jgi:hypothetical protein